MADESRELQEAMQNLRNAMQGLGEDAEKSKTGIKAFGEAAKQGAANLTKGMGALGMQVARGNTEFKTLNTMVDITSNALAGMAKAIPFAGEAVAAGLKAAAEGAKFMLEQMDQTTKAFNDLGKVGALTASGMSGLQQQFVRSGLTLNSFAKVVGENSVAMARFRGVTGDGAEEFTKITGALTQGDISLRRIGMSADQIGESTAAFVTQQTRLGRSQSMTTNELINGTKSYALELDLLSKVTGMSREAIQKQQDAALSESRFRANYEELMATGREKEAKALMDLQTRMSTFGAEMGQGTRDLISGAANTDAARKMMASTGGAAADIIQRMKEGQIDQNQAQIELQAAMKSNREAQLQNAKFVDRANSSYADFSQIADFTNQDFSQGFTKAKTAQEAQLKGQDQLTNDTVKAQQSMEKMNRELQDLGFKFLPNAASAVNSVTSAMKGLVEFINDKVLGKGGGGGAGSEQIEFDAMGNPTGMPAAAGGAGPATLTQAEMSAGLRIKSPEATAGGSASPRLYEIAQLIQSKLGGDLKHFSAFNDSYHQGTNSQHAQGRALDFTLTDPGRSAAVAAMVQSMPGVNRVIDEYTNPSSRATAGHIHAEISAARGAILSGPMGGYRPNLTMHGTEAIVPLNTPAAQNTLPGMDNGLLAAQLERLDELVSVMKNQLSVSTKIMQYAS